MKKSELRNAILTFLLIFALVFFNHPAGSFAYTASQLLPLGGNPTYLHGANLAWLDGAYSHDLGTDPAHPDWGCAYNSTHMSSYLGDMKSMNLNVVRIWLFENCEGLVFDANGYVSGIQSGFLTNLDDVVNNIAPAKNIYLYFTFTSSLVDTGHFNIVTDATARNAYLNNAIAAIANRYKGNNRIFAFDIMNECEADVKGTDGNWTTDKGTDWTTMQSFIRDNATKIHSIDSGRLVTSSSGWHGPNNIQKGYFKGLGLDFYDFHEYRDDGYIPDCSTLNADKPVILGEYGQSSTTWNDTTQNNADTNFMNNARDKGYAGALVWTYGYAGSTEVHNLLNSNGSWRPVCNTLKNFNPGTAPAPVVKYDWETTSLDGWTGSGVAGGPWRVTEWAYHGSGSLKADVTLSDNATYILTKQASDNLSGKSKLQAVVRHATWGSFGTGMTAKLFIQVGSSWTWYDGGTIPINSGTGGTVLTLNLAGISGLDQIKGIGVQFVAGTGTSGGTAVYVDYVTVQ